VRWFPPNQIWLDSSTGLGQWLFLPIVVSVQQGFRALQTTKIYVFDNGIKVVRRLTLGNSQSDTRQAGLDALAPATADTTLLLRAVVAHEEVPASSAGLENVAADPSVVAGGVVIIYRDETLDSAEGPKGPDSTGVAVVINMNTGGLDNVNVSTLARTAAAVDNEQLPKAADTDAKVPETPARPRDVASNSSEVTVAATIMNGNMPLGSAREKVLVGTCHEFCGARCRRRQGARADCRC